MKTTLLLNRSNYLKDIAEEKHKWLDQLLEYLGLDLTIIHGERSDLAVDYLFDNKIDIVEFPRIDAVRVTYQDQVVGEWAGPEFKLKEDSEKKALYYEVTIESWSVIEEEIDI